jgi:hypothetical protein
MPRYFFHVRDGEGVRLDIEGSAVAGLQEAHATALADAKLILAEHLRGGGVLSIALDQVVEVVDEDGVTVLEVPFTEAAEADMPRP